jgi:hypothetical protein
VGKGDVQLAFGWNNAQAQQNAQALSFTYNTAETYTALSIVVRSVRTLVKLANAFGVAVPEFVQGSYIEAALVASQRKLVFRCSRVIKGAARSLPSITASKIVKPTGRSAAAPPWAASPAPAPAPGRITRALPQVISKSIPF